MQKTLMPFLLDFVNLTTDTFEDKEKRSVLGIYLHGSAAMQCYNPHSSDVDLLVVLADFIKPTAQKLSGFVGKMLALEKKYDGIRIEMSIVSQSALSNDFDRPPFVLHYSDLYKKRYLLNDQDLCISSHDQDLNAHFFMAYARGICLYGKAFKRLYLDKEPNYEAYEQAIYQDVDVNYQQFSQNPIYFLLNASRIWQYTHTRLAHSKKEGAMWAIEKLPQAEANTLQGILDLYLNDKSKGNIYLDSPGDTLDVEGLYKLFCSLKKNFPNPGQ